MPFRSKDRKMPFAGAIPVRGRNVSRFCLASDAARFFRNVASGRPLPGTVDLAAHLDGHVRVLRLAGGWDRAELASRLRRRKVDRGDAMRAEIILLAADGLSNMAIAARLGVFRVTVATWRRRFAGRRLDGLHDEPRPGRRVGSSRSLQGPRRD
jgi:hypothetical protein